MDTLGLTSGEHGPGDDLIMLTPTALVLGTMGTLLPEGYAAVAWPESGVPASDGEPNGGLRLALVARKTGASPAGPDVSPAGGPLVVLRDLLDARVLLGCLIDGSDHVHRWVEVWVQDIAGLAQALPTYRETLTNSKLDERWTARADAMVGLVRAGWETKHPSPIVLDAKALTLRYLANLGTSDLWALCADDAVLAKVGLPAYSSSLHRYIHVPALGEKSMFVAVTAGALENERTAGVAHATGTPAGTASSIVPVNLGGGLMMVCPHEPLSYESYVDALSGLEAESILATAGAAAISIVAMAAGAGMSSGGKSKSGASGAVKVHVPGSLSGGLLSLGRGGRAGRLIETLHLKLRVLADVFEIVRDQTADSQRPMLNVCAASFGVRLNSAAWGVPALWSAEAVPRVPGEASSVDVPGSDVSYFVATGRGAPTVYSPPLAGRAMGGAGSFQIRSVRTESGATALEGTLRSQERLSVGANDLVWIRMSLGATRVQLYAMAESKTSSLASELRVRTLPQRLSESADSALKSSEGVVVPGVMFETLALAGPACDLYSLAVLAARTLLVDGKMTLPVAWDELQSLAAQVASQHDGSVGLGLRIRSIFEEEDGKAPSRWLEQLGPQHLTRERWDARDALAAVTPEVWYDVLAAAVRCVPGAGPDSVCQGYGEAPTGMIHRVFDRACEDWRDLLLRTRGLVISDHATNREVHQIVSKFLSGAAVR